LAAGAAVPAGTVLVFTLTPVIAAVAIAALTITWA